MGDYDRGGWGNQGGFNQGGFNQGGGFNDRGGDRGDSYGGAWGGGRGGGGSRGGGFSNVRPGDWSCPNGCGNVFASKSNCFRCGVPKPEGAGDDFNGGGNFNGGGDVNGGGYVDPGQPPRDLGAPPAQGGY